MKSQLERKARAFWTWFSEVAGELATNLENERILGELDRRVASFGDVTWEVGPGLLHANALVISPAGNKELLPITREIVQLAPTIPEWEFHSTKPPKQWQLRFIVPGVDGKPFEVDANNWDYVLLKMPDGVFDILIRAPDFDTPSEETKQIAGELAVEGLLGELRKLQSIANVDVVSEFNDIDRKRATPLKHLSDHLRLLNPS